MRLLGIMFGHPGAFVQSWLKLGLAGSDEATNCAPVVGSVMSVPAADRSPPRITAVGVGLLFVPPFRWRSP